VRSRRACRRREPPRRSGRLVEQLGHDADATEPLGARPIDDLGYLEVGPAGEGIDLGDEEPIARAPGSQVQAHRTEPRSIGEHGVEEWTEGREADAAGDDDDVPVEGGLHGPASSEWAAQGNLSTRLETGQRGCRGSGRPDRQIEAIYTFISAVPCLEGGPGEPANRCH